MKALWNTLVLTLAINFTAVAGIVGWLYQSKHLDRQRVGSIKEILFPPQTDAAATQPSAPQGPIPPSQRLQALLSQYSGSKSAVEQVEFIQQAFDGITAQLDRREREVGDREQQVAMASSSVVARNKLLDEREKKLNDRERQTDRLATDKGFQDTLNLYNTMPSRQARDMFMKLDEASAAEYFDAMQPRNAAKIMKEFKTPDESERLRRILEKMRHPPGIAAAATVPPAKE